LVERLSEGPPALVGIDHGFSFPLQYFEKHGLPLDWPAFLDDFQRHWPTDEDIYVDFVRDGSVGNGAARSGNPRWRRVTELRARFSITTCKGRWRSQHTQAFRGYAIFGSTLRTACIFGRSTGGTCSPTVR